VDVSVSSFGLHLNYLARRDHYHYRQQTTTHQHCVLPYSDRLQPVLAVVESAGQKL
jgi:hypothetical protein